MASGKLEILPTGKIFGSITTKDLNIRSGAVFVGKSNMPEGEKGIVAASEPSKDEKEVAGNEPDYEVE